MKSFNLKYHEDNLWDKKIASSIINGSYGKDFTNQVVVDIGANIGAFTVLASQTAKKVYAFEPETDNFNLLKENTKGLDNVEIHRVAIGKRGKMKLFCSTVNYGNHTLFPGERTNLNRIIIVDGKKLEDFNIPEIDFLKCDCEGAEYEIFKDDIIAKNIVVEAHNVVDEPDKFNWLVSRLENLGYSLKVKNSDATSCRMIYGTRT